MGRLGRTSKGQNGGEGDGNLKSVVGSTESKSALYLEYHVSWYVCKVPAWNSDSGKTGKDEFGKEIQDHVWESFVYYAKG